MGVITVEKHLFYLEAMPQDITPAGPLNISGDAPKPYTRVQLALRHQRLPWEGEKARTILYMHDNQIGGQPREKMPSTIDFMRRYLLGNQYPQPVFHHPKLLIADIPSPRLLMTKEEICNYLLQAYAQTRRSGWLKEQPIRPPPLQFFRDAWLLYDPTMPGIARPSRDQWRRGVKTLFPNKKISVQQHTIIKGSETAPNPDTIIPIGMAYRIRYLTSNEPAPPNAVWVKHIRARVNAYLQQHLPGKSSSTEWYVLGKYELPDLLIQVPARRPANIPTYRGARKVPLSPKENLVTRRLFTVQARDMEEARHAAEKYMGKLIQNPNTRLQGLKFANAWERGGHQVLSRQGWDMIRKKYAGLKEEFYRRDSHRRVY